MPFAKSLSGFRPGVRRELLNLNCTRDRSIAGAQQLVEIAVHHYFGHRAKLKQLEFRHLLKERTGGLFSAFGDLYEKLCRMRVEVRKRGE
jgi:hypothetical protein